MNTPDLTVNELKIAIEKQLNHSYLEKFIQKPVIDEDKLLILSSLLQNTTFSEHKKKNYIVTTMLVQIALDTHDLVTETADKDESDLSRKTRQLTVLAGDYYSGLYYYILSELSDIPMIHTLASAIKEINELKMSIYYKEFNSVQDLMDSLKKLESLLIQRVAEHIQRTSILELTGDWLLMRKLIREKKTFLNKGRSPVFDLLTEGLAYNVNGNQIVYTVEDTIQKHVSHVEDAISHLPVQFHSLKLYANAILDDNLGKNTIVVEEG
nr:heptaprenyl diphosphate synthase component 1 [Aquibacillus saliphilus]